MRCVDDFNPVFEVTVGEVTSIGGFFYAFDVESELVIFRPLFVFFPPKLYFVYYPLFLKFCNVSKMAGAHMVDGSASFLRLCFLVVN